MSILFVCNCNKFDEEELVSLQIFMNELKSNIFASCVSKLDSKLFTSVSKGIMDKARSFLKISNQFDGNIVKYKSRFELAYFYISNFSTIYA